MNKVIIVAILAVLSTASFGCRSFQKMVNEDPETIEKREARKHEEEQQVSGLDADLNEYERSFIDNSRKQSEIDRKASRKRVFGY